MPSQTAKPSYDAKRRIKLLFGFSIFLIIAATATWYFVAGQINKVANNAIEAQRIKGIQIDCSNRSVKGYPFRFGVFCDSLRIAGRSRGPSFQSGSIRSAAQFYDPKRIIVEMDAPANLSIAGGQNIALSWSQMRASTIVDDPLPESLSIVGQQFKLRGPQGSLAAEQIEAYMRVVDTDVDFAGRVAALEFEESIASLDDLPALGMDFDFRLDEAVTKLASNQFNLRGINGTLNRAAILLNADRGILISGPVSVADNGLVDAQLKVRIVDVDAVVEVISKALPNFAPALSAFAQGQPRVGENKDEIELNVTIAEGQARMGLFPLGAIPPI